MLVLPAGHHPPHISQEYLPFWSNRRGTPLTCPREGVGTPVLGQKFTPALGVGRGQEWTSGLGRESPLLPSGRSREYPTAGHGGPVLQGHGANGAGEGECVEAVQLAACWRGGELPPVPDGGPAVEVAQVYDKSRHIPASLWCYEFPEMMSSLNTHFQEGKKGKTKKMYVKVADCSSDLQHWWMQVQEYSWSLSNIDRRYSDPDQWEGGGQRCQPGPPHQGPPKPSTCPPWPTAPSCFNLRVWRESKTLEENA
jgi:hypothetical protein